MDDQPKVPDPYRYPLIVAAVKKILYEARTRGRFRQGLAKSVWREKTPAR